MHKRTFDYSNELILIVDDDEEIARLCVELLSQSALEARHVVSGSEALKELVKENSYTFMVADISMPGIDGLELTKKVKKLYPNICVIVMTGYSDDYSYISVIDAGATDFISKPLKIEELEAKIRRAIIERNTKQELLRLSVTDSLTGLYNHRHFYKRLEEEIMRANRQNQPLAMILLDLDDFKQYNDKYGHLAGDNLLKKLGKIINSIIRKGVDSAYRYGGDEFAIILGDSDLDDCKNIVQRIEKASLAECNTYVSTGYACMENGMTPELLVGKADNNLYKNKELKKAITA